MKILVTGATGYVGSKLVPVLVSAGHEVRCMVRNPSAAKADELPAGTLVQGDALDAGSLPSALEGIDVAYYLIHSMGGNEAGFEERDLRAARNFATAAKQAGVQRLIFLGGLASQASPTSDSHYIRTSHIRASEEPPRNRFDVA